MRTATKLCYGSTINNEYDMYDMSFYIFLNSVRNEKEFHKF